MSREYPCIYWEKGICKLYTGGEVTSWCVESPCADQKPSNADRIRSMTDEELAEWLVGKTFYRESAWSEPSYLNFLTGRSEAYKDAVSGTKEWLKQPAEEDI